MSKINYCSLDEAWGDPYNNDNNIDKNEKKEKVDVQKNNNNDKIYGRTNYDYLNENSKVNRNNIIQNMNSVERNNISENNNNNENNISIFNKYRFNSRNNVKQNNYEKQYTPFEESIDKKYLQDKINYLENEFNKYKLLTESIPSNNNNIENFNNQSEQNNSDNNNSNGSNDIIDLIILIIIGLIVIFVMNSIFNIGKAIGARK